MLPVLFTLTVPAAWTWPLVGLAFVAIATARAWAYRRRSDGDGERPGWGAALWDDKLTLGVMAAVVVAMWRGGFLDGGISLPLHTYGLMIAAGFVAAISLVQREARRQGQDAERIGDLAFWVLVAALVGSRLYFIAVNWNDYFGDNA